MTDKIKQAVQRLADHWNCDVSGLAGQSLRQLFDAADSEPGVYVYWGFWTDSELDTVIE